MSIEINNSASLQQKSAGATLLELIMVVAIVGAVGAGTLYAFLSGSTTPEGTGYCQGLAQTLAGCLEKDIRNTQSEAMLRGPGYSIAQAPDVHHYKISDDAAQEVTTRYLSEDVTIAPAFNISFDGLGRPSWAGDLTLTQDMGASANPRTKTIGVVHIEENTGAVWVVPQ